MAPLRAFASLLLASTAWACGQDGDPVKVPTRPAVVTLAPRPVLLDRNGVTIYNGGFGSGLARHPDDSTRFYLLTDRGPNFEMPVENRKTFPAPGYQPVIGLYRLAGDTLVLERRVPLSNASGDPLSGLPNPAGRGGTGEVPLDSTGAVLQFDPDGVDSEGLAALPDGSFWISDEYGPGLVHLDAGGRTLARLDPFRGDPPLPRVLARRRPNRGFEGLAASPDGRTLFAMLESPLDNPKEAGRASRAIRILALELDTGATRQYVYLTEDPVLTANGLDVIPGGDLLVLERDDRFPGDSTEPSRVKRVYRVSLAGATDVSDPANGDAGLRIDGRTLEAIPADSLPVLGLTPVRKTLLVDLLAPEVGYPHNKPEGVVFIDRTTIAVSNDDDFGITDDGQGGIRAKILPLTGAPDQTTVRFIRVEAGVLD